MAYKVDLCLSLQVYIAPWQAFAQAVFSSGNKKAGLSLLSAAVELSEGLNLRQPAMFIFGFAPLNIVQGLA